MAEDPVFHGPGQVQPLPGIGQVLGDPVAVDLVAEGERALVQPLQFALSGVAEGGVAEVVTEADGKGQVLH